MSLHARLSPEAEERLRAQKRNASISSIVIGILTMVFMALVLAFIFLPSLWVETPTIVTYAAGTEDEEKLQEKRVNTQVKRNPAAPSSALAKVIASTTPSPTAVPVPDLDVRNPSAQYGSGDDFGSGWGSGGDGGGGGFGNIPANMRKRCSKADRMSRLAKAGGTPQCEDAVVKALRYLQKRQNKDGSWDQQYRVAMTGFALLAYLGHCETPLSPEFGDTVTSAIVYLVNVSTRHKGKMGTNFGERHWPYEHAVATYALAEAYTFSNQVGLQIPNLDEAVQNSVQWIINNQHKSGGWDYSYSENSKRGGDLSITAWHLQALKAAGATRLDFRNFRTCVSNGTRFVTDTQNRNGGFGYMRDKKPVGSAKGYFTLTGAGVLCLQQHRSFSNSSARRGVAYLSKHTRFDYRKGPANLYEHYYNGQAIMNHGGESWKKYNKLFRDQVLKAQGKDGSWPSPKDPGPGWNNSVTYRTALATLILEVYYRFLPGTG